MELEPVIGLEVHVQLGTETKLFCGCPTTFGAAPNTLICPTCLGYPGALPVPNQQAVAYGIRAALAFGCQIATLTKFDRKNYFYPDLPKGYQISQFDIPYAAGGRVPFDLEDGTMREVELVRIHLEEDAGKSIHEAKSDTSFIDLNRCGTPLLEMVSTPTLRNAKEASQYLKAIRDVLRWIGVSEVNMEQGALRCDVNVSVRPRGSDRLGTRTETKNLNSFFNVEKAIAQEFERQSAIVRSGGTIVQETRLYDAEREVTVMMRSKEEAHDYRYFPEPDLPRLAIEPELVEAERSRLGELPRARRLRYQEKLGLSPYDAALVVSDRSHSEYFEAMLAAGVAAKPAANWFQTEVLRHLNEEKVGIGAFPLRAADLATIIAAAEQGKISVQNGRQVLRDAITTGADPKQLLAKLGDQISDSSALERWIDEALASDPGAVAKIKAGDPKPASALTGKVMRLSGGKANPRSVTELILKRVRG